MAFIPHLIPYPKLRSVLQLVRNGTWPNPKIISQMGFYMVCAFIII